MALKYSRQRDEILTFLKEFIDFLTEIRTERNFFVHNVFKDDLFTKAFQDNPKQLHQLLPYSSHLNIQDKRPLNIILYNSTYNFISIFYC